MVKNLQIWIEEKEKEDFDARARALKLSSSAYGRLILFGNLEKLKKMLEAKN